MVSFPKVPGSLVRQTALLTLGATGCRRPGVRPKNSLAWIRFLLILVSLSKKSGDEIYLAWSQWSSSVGLCENLAKCEVSAVGKRKTEDARQVFDPSRVSPAIRVLGAVSCSVRRAYRAAEVVASKPLGSVLGCWGAVVSPFPCNFGISVSSPCLRLTSVGWLALLLGPLPSSCGPVSGLLCVGVGTAVLGSAVSSSVGTCTLMLFGLPASSLRSFGTICPRVLVLSGRVILALPPMLCVLG